MNARIMVATILTSLVGPLATPDVRASQFYVGVQGAGSLTDSNPVSLSFHVSIPAGTNNSGFVSADGIAAARSGQVGSSAMSAMSLPDGDSGGSAGTSMNCIADMQLSGLILGGPAGGRALISFNINVTGAIGVGTDGSGGSGGLALVAMRYNLGNSFAGGGGDLGQETVNAAGIFSSSGIFSTDSWNTTGQATTTTASILVNVGDPFLSFGLNLQTESAVFGSSGSSFAFANFEHTAGFPTSGPVANLPDGYTLNSLDGSIVNNHFVGAQEVPQPSALTLAAIGLGMVALLSALHRARVIQLSAVSE